MSTISTISVTSTESDNSSVSEERSVVSRHTRSWLGTYFSKWTGQHKKRPLPTMTFFESLFVFVYVFLSMGALAAVHYRVLVTFDLALFIASFGATAVLVYGLPLSPLAQPRNVVGGQVISAIIGCSVRLLFGTNGEIFVAAALSVSLTVFVMQMTDTVHAPAGATALIIIIGNASYPWAGFQYILMPVLSGSIILVLFGVVLNNLIPSRHYPCYWW